MSKGYSDGQLIRKSAPDLLETNLIYRGKLSSVRYSRKIFLTVNRIFLSVFFGGF